MKIISRSIEHQQESIKGNWSSSGATEHTKECHGHFDWLHLKTLSMKNRYYARKVRESLEIDMAVVKYGQDKVLNRDNGNFVRTNAWKPLFKKWKHYIEISRHFVLSDGLACTFISLKTTSTSVAEISRFE